jgi:hypothetical protein
LLDGVLSIVLVLTTILLQVRWSPRFVEMESDSGLFAYGGQRALHGALLYRDVFDTKPPLVFYLNAAALRLGGESVWPIWALSFLWIAATVLAFFFLLKAVTRRGAAFATTMLFLAVLHDSAFYQGGNFTEIFALLPQVLVVGATVWYLHQGRWTIVLGIGGLTAVAFLCKPTYVVMGVVSLSLILGLEIAGGRWRAATTRMAAFVAGLAAVLAIVAAYWGLRGGLADLVDALFVYGAAYVRGGLSARSLYGSLRKLTVGAPMANLTVLVVAGALLCGWELRERRRGRQAQSGAGRVPVIAGGGRSTHPISTVFVLALVAIPLEWALAALSGQNFGHYFITPLPAMAIMAAFALDRAWSGSLNGDESRRWHFAFSGVTTTVAALAIVLGVVEGLPARSQLNSFLDEPYGGAERTSPLVGYLADHSAPDETVLIWGNQPAMYFQSGRVAPSRFVFTSQILLNDGHAGERLNELLLALQRRKPAIVAEEIDPEINFPSLFDVVAQGCSGCPDDAKAAMASLREFVADEYGGATNVADWMVSRRLPNSGEP